MSFCSSLVIKALWAAYQEFLASGWMALQMWELPLSQLFDFLTYSLIKELEVPPSPYAPITAIKLIMQHSPSEKKYPISSLHPAWDCKGQRKPWN
jgi:hypothetical protein